MDYDTGLVGAVRKISYQMMIETCESIRERGSRLPNVRPTRDELRATIQQLIRRGMLELISKRMQQPVYRLPLATVNRSSPTATFYKKPSSGGGGSSSPIEEQPMNNQAEQPEKGNKEQPEKEGVKPLNILSFEDRSNQKNNQKNNHHKEGMNDIHQGSGLNLTIPAHISLSDEELKQVPNNASKWCEFFTQYVRFDVHEVKSVNTMTLFRLWCEDKVSVGEAVIAIEAAEQKIGKRPDTPKFYKNFVAQVIQDRNAKNIPQGVNHVKSSKRATAEEIAREQLGGHRVYEYED